MHLTLLNKITLEYHNRYILTPRLRNCKFAFQTTGRNSIKISTYIEAAQKIKRYDTDRLFLAYAVKCIKNKFCTLYKEHCAEVPTESDTEILLEKNSNAYTEEGYRDIVLAIDLNAFIRGINSGKKQKIAILFLVFQKSDSEIASMLGVSRQYVNRVRRELLTELASFYS
ncbi:sigma-70 family RNA polymerase sigma factor [Fusobacterium naviforme]|nr:sigma-70 family RNA polymerase sigma factor [Fusobacterium naviforme]